MTEASAALTIGLSNPDFMVKMPYHLWEEAFIERWLGRPRDLGAGAKQYLTEQRIDPRYLTCRQALRAFWMNELSFPSQELGMRFLLEVNDLVEEIVEPELDQEDWDRLQLEKDDREAIERGYKTIYMDMGKGFDR